MKTEYFARTAISGVLFKGIYQNAAAQVNSAFTDESTTLDLKAGNVFPGMLDDAGLSG